MSGAILRVRFCGLLLLLVLVLDPGGQHKIAFADRLNTDSLYQPCQHGHSAMNATREQFRGRSIVWQIPENPRGILFFANALRKRPEYFFDFGPNCKQCYGFPEERLTTLDALQNGYAVIALESIDSATSWIVWPLDTSDLDNAVALLEWWPKRHNLEGLPLVAWGQSIGGAFVASLAASYRLPLKAIIVMTAIDLSDQLALVNSSFPPAMFVYFGGNRYQRALPSDEQTSEHVAALARSGVRVASVRLDAERLTPQYLTERIHCLKDAWSQKLFEYFHHAEILDADNFLRMNPNSAGFSEYIRRSHALPYCKKRSEVCLQVDVQNELKRAYGVHAFSSGGNKEVFSWIQSTLGSNEKNRGALLVSDTHSYT